MLDDVPRLPTGLSHLDSMEWNCHRVDCVETEHNNLPGRLNFKAYPSTLHICYFPVFYTQAMIASMNVIVTEEKVREGINGGSVLGRRMIILPTQRHTCGSVAICTRVSSFRFTRAAYGMNGWQAISSALFPSPHELAPLFRLSIYFTPSLPTSPHIPLAWMLRCPS